MFTYKHLIRVIALTGLSLLFSACTTFTTKELPKEAAPLIQEVRNGKVFLIHDLNRESEMVLTEVAILNDSLLGVLSPRPEGRMHYPRERSFERSRVRPFHPRDVIHIYSSEVELTPGAFAIPLNSIYIAEYHKADHGATFAKTGGVVVLGGVAGLLIACNCPQVATIDEADAYYHGSLFPGAILHSLQRDDYLVIDQPLSEKDGNLHIQIYNEQAETQYFDQLEVLQVMHEDYPHLALSHEQEMLAYRQVFRPLAAFTASGTDLVSVLSHPNDATYAFDDLSMDEELSSVELQFNRSVLTEQPALVLRAQQSSWLDTVGTYISYQAGRSYERWTERNDDISPEKWRKRNIRRGLSMNVYLKAQDEWIYQGSFHDAGTNGWRDLIMPLGLEVISDSPKLEIKLESAFKLWELDFAGVTEEWTAELSMHPLEVFAAETTDGENVQTLLAETDGHYLILDSIGSAIHLQVGGWTGTPGMSLLLHGVGYYHRHSTFDGKPNLAFFLKLRTRTGLQELSRLLYDYRLQQSVGLEPSDPMTEPAIDR